MLINLGRLLMLCVWAFLLLNLFQPFPKPLNIFVNVALIFMILMHGLQLTLLKATQPKEAPPLSRFEQIRIFIFGVFELVAWQKKTEGDAEKNSPEKGSGIGRKRHERCALITQHPTIADAQRVILRRVKAKHHLQPTVFGAKARFIAHLTACRRHRLLPRAPIVNHFFPFIADDNPLL